MRQGKQGEAVEAFTRWLQANELSDNTFAAISIALQRDPDMDLAFSVAQDLSVRFPDNPTAHVGEARLALAINQREFALQAADKALAIDAKLVEALLVKAQVQISMGQSPSAVATLQTAVTEQPDSMHLHMGFAQLLIDSGLYDRAGPILQRTAELSEGDADTWLRLGLLSLTARRYEQAETYLTGVLKDDPYNDRAQFYLGRLADRQRDSDTAIAFYDAVPQGEFFLPARIRAAELSADSGNVTAGLERIRELSPLTTDPATKVQLVSAESRILQNADRHNEAVEVLTAGLESYPANSELLYARALAAEAIGNDTQFEKDLGQLLDADPDNAHALNALGYHLVVHNTRLAEAQLHLERAASLEPEDAAIMDSLGWLRFRQGRLDESKTLLQQAYALFPDAEIAAHLGEVLWMVGEEQGARDLWNKALIDAPDHKVLNDVVNRFIE